MKTSKSPEETEVTPSKKKLKQARLPFKIISEVSPSPVASPPTRKRKLSSPEEESVTKVGKISKENDIVEDAVVISDEESKDGQTTETQKIPNPYVKLVDAARKKKLQKSKGANKKKGKRKGSLDKVENGEESAVQFCSVMLSPDHASDKSFNDCDVMEVDEPAKETADENETGSHKTIQKETENTVNKSKKDSDIVVLEDSNSCCEIQKVSNNTEETLVSTKESEPKEVDEKSTDSKPEQSTETNLDQDVNESGPKESLEISDTESDKKSENEEIKTPITPKRSARNKAKHEENNNSKGSPGSSKLNESMSSNPSTPKHSRSSSATKLDESINESTPMANLTPKQLQKRLESAKKREEREKEKQEREKKRQLEKDERAKQRQEKEEQRKREREEKEEAKKKEKEEKEEQRKKEKEEKEKQKELEKKLREEKEEQKRKEKEEKEEQKKKEREAREEEKRKKQEALELEKQEQELKKKKTAEAFVSFFVPKQKAEKDHVVGTVSNNMLSNFTLKSDMRLAPTTRSYLTKERATELVKLIEEQSIKEDRLYLKNLRNGISKPLSSGKTWPLSDKDEDDVILVEDEMPPVDDAGEVITCEPAVRENLRPKLLSFHENRRPPYWGTWRKKSKFVKPRKPFGQDEKLLDYEVDSDDDWEEEQEGESIDGSAAGSDDEQGPDEYEVDNEVFVPHGYLSDEEATMDEEDNNVLSLSPETQKARLKHLEDEFESEMKKPTEKLKPRFYGPLWENSEGGKPDNCIEAMWNHFGKLAMIVDPSPILQPPQETAETEKKKVKKKKVQKEGTTEAEQKSPKSEKKKKSKPQEKESKPAPEKKNVQETKKNQPGINMFLTKFKST